MPPSSLLCPICYESFDDKDRIPVLLDQCGHSFCRSCLKAGGSSINRCPQCRQSITKSISNLKTNHALVEALDVEKIASEWKGEPWFEEQDVSYATILASMQSDVLDSVLKKLKVAGFDVNKVDDSFWGLDAELLSAGGLTLPEISAFLNTMRRFRGALVEASPRTAVQSLKVPQGALVSACRSGSLMAMKTMLDSGADVNEMVDGRTSLHWAAAMGFKEKLALLLQRDANPNAAVLGSKSTPLHEAAAGGYLDCISLLLDTGASVSSITSDKGRTPLHLAAMNGHLDSVSMLLRRGAKSNVYDFDDKLPASLAFDNRHSGLEALLLFGFKGAPWEPFPEALRPPPRAMVVDKDEYDDQPAWNTPLSAKPRSLFISPSTVPGTSSEPKASATAFMPSPPWDKVTRSNMSLGLRVELGHDYVAKHDDNMGGDILSSGSTGIIIEDKDDGWANVLWDNGRCSCVRVGDSDKYELKLSSKECIQNREKRKVKRGEGHLNGWQNDLKLPSNSLYYCGARVNQCRCGHCDGQCGPTGGCPCSACIELVGFVVKDGKAVKYEKPEQLTHKADTSSDTEPEVQPPSERSPFRKPGHLRARRGGARKPEPSSQIPSSAFVFSPEAAASFASAFTPQTGVTFPHPGSLSACGGNPDGVAMCNGYLGNCSAGCRDCGAGTHWTCCGGGVSCGKHCLAGISQKQANDNVRIFGSSSSVPRKCKDIPGVSFATPAFSSSPAGSSPVTSVPLEAKQSSDGIQFELGDLVSLAAGKSLTADSGSGPLDPGDIGEVIISEDPLKEVAGVVLVKHLATGKRWWYDNSMLQKINCDLEKTLNRDLKLSEALPGGRVRLNKNMISAMGENGFFGLTSNDVGTIVSQHSDILNLSLGPLLLVAWDKWGGSGTMRCHTYMKDLRPVEHRLPRKVTGSILHPFVGTLDQDPDDPTQKAVFQSVSAMEQGDFRLKSHEELRWEDFQRRDKLDKFSRASNDNAASVSVCISVVNRSHHVPLVVTLCVLLTGDVKLHIHVKQAEEVARLAIQVIRAEPRPFFRTTYDYEAAVGSSRGIALAQSSSSTLETTLLEEDEDMGLSQGASKSSILLLQSIVAMPEYKEESVEMLRWQDYMLGLKVFKNIPPIPTTGDTLLHPDLKVGDYVTFAAGASSGSFLSCGGPLTPGGPFAPESFGIIFEVNACNGTCKIVELQTCTEWWYERISLRVATLGQRAKIRSALEPRMVVRSDPGPMQVGSYVTVSDDYESHGDASGGHLRPNKFGKVISCERRFKVESMDGRSSWWYDVGALKAVHEVEANGGPAPTQGPTTTVMLMASAQGLSDIVSNLARENPESVNRTSGDSEGLSPLHVACVGGHVDVVKKLLSCGASCNMLSKGSGSSALHLVSDSKHGCLSTASVLLGCKDVDVNVARKDDGATPLYLASKCNNMEMTSLLLKHGASLHSTVASVKSKGPADGLRVHSASSNALSAVNVLKRDDSRWQSDGSDGPSYRHWIIFEVSKGLQCGEFHYRRRSNDEDLSDGYAPDHFKVDVGPNPSCLRNILEAHIPLSSQNGPNGIVKLCSNIPPGTQFIRLWAHYSGGCDTRLYGVEVVIRGQETGGSALHAAAAQGHCEMVKLLLASGANVDQDKRALESDDHSPGCTASSDSAAVADSTTETETGFGETPLREACRAGHVDVARILLDGGADLSVTMGDGSTSLHEATDRGFQSLVRLLLERGADVNLRLKEMGKTPLHIAAERGHTEVLKILLEFTTDANPSTLNPFGRVSPLCLAAQCSHDAAAAVLLTSGALPDWPTCGKSLPPLASAASCGSLALAKLLVDHGADVNLISPQGDGATPLFLAASRGHSDIVQLLCDSGANVDLPDKNGTTPLMAACNKKHAEVARVLLSAGADINYINPRDVNKTVLTSSAGGSDAPSLTSVLGADHYVTVNDRHKREISDPSSGVMRRGRHAELTKSERDQCWVDLVLPVRALGLDVKDIAAGQRVGRGLDWCWECQDGAGSETTPLSACTQPTAQPVVPSENAAGPSGDPQGRDVVPAGHSQGGLQGRGVVLGPSQSEGWCRVKWDHDGSINEYRVGAEDCYDLHVFVAPPSAVVAPDGEAPPADIADLDSLAGVAQPAGTDLSLRVGVVVVLSPGYREVEDADLGPLQPGGQRGVIDEMDSNSATPIMVRVLETSEVWWYREAALRAIEAPPEPPQLEQADHEPHLIGTSDVAAAEIINAYYNDNYVRLDDTERGICDNLMRNAVATLASSETDTSDRSLALLFELSKRASVEVRDLIVAAGALEHLLQIVASSGVTERLLPCELAFGLLQNLTANHPANKAAALSAPGVVQALVRALSSPSNVVKQRGAATLGNLARVGVVAAQAVAEAGAMPHLARLAGSTDETVKSEAGKALRRIRSALISPGPTVQPPALTDPREEERGTRSSSSSSSSSSSGSSYTTGYTRSRLPYSFHTARKR